MPCSPGQTNPGVKTNTIQAQNTSANLTMRLHTLIALPPRTHHASALARADSPSISATTSARWRCCTTLCSTGRCAASSASPAAVALLLAALNLQTPALVLIGLQPRGNYTGEPCSVPQLSSHARCDLERRRPSSRPYTSFPTSFTPTPHGPRSPEILVIGTGDKTVPVSAELRAEMRSHGIALEVLDTVRAPPRACPFR